ncbi:hypothetical protein ES319_A02G120400v1 [Gossypium barbadense]|uniref:ER membrane protein complex subunit 10 n=2 Tax=Gossypium TaxID=3633 RepID=A0A5J5WQP5_GOSBA|nr:hypothetical protein ES319_A02G120400v1 [Gossypium barbadense]TYH28296.1 hypothetical protein ES288_A02G132800v1 [Gossypium darwinii]
MKWVEVIVSFILTLSFLSFPSCGFQSDELLVDDEEFGLEGAPQHRSPEPIPTRSPPVTSPTRKRHSDLDSDSKIQFSLDHAFGDSDFSPAGTFSARLKTWSHGGQEGVNVLAVNYGSPGSCPYPRNLKLPAKWSFSSHTVLKNSEQAPRAPVFTEEILGGENAEGEVVQPAERSFWAKYWMYLIPLGLIVMNAITQAMNMPEEQATGQVPAQGQLSAGAVQRGPSSAVRRR